MSDAHSFAGIVEGQVDASFSLRIQADVDAGSLFDLGRWRDPSLYMCPQCGTPGLQYWLAHHQVNCQGCSYWAVIIGRTTDGRLIVARPTGGL